MKIKEKDIIKAIQKGELFIYPTDTIYGLGCNALNKRAVNKIKEIKSREKNKPLSIIAPSKSWIFKNLKANRKIIKKYLPGRYTLILKKKNPRFLNHVSRLNSLGVRIPKNNFTKLISKAKVPFITTSVNLSGKKPALTIEKINKKILSKVDMIIKCKGLSGRPSTIIFENGSKLKR